MPNRQLQRSIVKNFKKRRVCSFFKHNIWAVDLANLQLISKYNKIIRYLLCVIHLFSKYAWVVPLKDKIRVIISNVFQKKF